jgi:hypothetical protein
VTLYHSINGFAIYIEYQRSRLLRMVFAVFGVDLSKADL